jgi:hypothetical protein
MADLLPGLDDPLGLGTAVAPVADTNVPPAVDDSGQVSLLSGAQNTLSNLSSGIGGDFAAAGTAVSNEFATLKNAAGSVGSAASTALTYGLWIGGGILVIAALAAVGYAVRAFK